MFVVCIQADLEAAIHVPGSVFKNVPCKFPYCSTNKGFKLQFVVYKNAKLFPVLDAEGTREERQEKQKVKEKEGEETSSRDIVSTPVISTQIGKDSLGLGLGKVEEKEGD